MKRPTDDLDISSELDDKESTSSRPTDNRPIEPIQEDSGERMNRDEVLPPDIIDKDGGSTETSPKMTEGDAEENGDESTGEEELDNVSKESISPELSGKEESAEKEDNETVEAGTVSESTNENTEAPTLPPVTLVPMIDKSASPTTVGQLLADGLTKPTSESVLDPAVDPGRKGGRGDNPHQKHPQRDSIKGSKESKDFSSDVSQGGSVNCQATGGLFSRYSCQAAVSIQEHNIFYVGMTTILVLYCLLRWFCCPSNRIKHDDRGEYRAVAEQYGNYNDEAFFDEFSAPESYEEDDDYQDDWSAGPPKKSSIEMVNREQNGGLTLEEMNG